MLEGFPALSEYIEGLPEGLSSHPECKSKASIYRALLEGSPLSDEAIASLPDVLQPLAIKPAPVSSWVPEVHSHALMLAVYDRNFSGLSAFAKHAYDRQRAMLEGPLYAFAFRLAGPMLLVKTAALRWRLFHRGMRVAVVDPGDGRGKFRLDYPVGIYEPILLRTLAEALRAAMDMCSGGGAVVDIGEASPTHAVLDFLWRPDQ